MGVIYTSSLDGVTTDGLTGFFVGWRSPLTPAQHLEVLRRSRHVWLAMDGERVVGFINALSDGFQAAFIPLLEVLPEYQGQGVGSELVRLMLSTLEGLRCIDLTCDPELQPFYERFGMLRSCGMVIRNY